MYSITGCNTNCYPCSKGKVTAWNIVMKTEGTENILSFFGEDNVTEEQIVNSCTQFFLSLYGKKAAANLTDARYQIFSSHKNPPPLKKLRPIEENPKFHFM